MMKHMAIIMLLLITTVFGVFSQDDEDDLLTVMTWNVESGDADAEIIAQRLAEFDDVDLWGLSEVITEDADLFESAAEEGEDTDFTAIVGTTGGEDRLLVLYDSSRFEALDVQELDEMNFRGNVRSPLVVHFVDLATGQEFLFMVNHLWRGNETGRYEQARLLNLWAAEQDLPIVAVGDYNFDFEIETGERDIAYDLFVADDVFTWVRPDELVRTQCSLDRNDNTQCFFNSVLDFVFVAGDAKQWEAISEIVVDEGDFPDDETTSDHRPVLAIFEITEANEAADGMTRDEILARIAELEAEIAELEALLEELPE